MEGFIKLYRKMLENPVICKDSDHLAVWVFLLLNATHKEYPALFKGEKIVLNPGQLITGRKAISVKLNIAESKVQRILKTFEIEHQIEQLTSNANRLITISNWNEYQQNEQQFEQPVNNERTPSEQPVDTNKNKKKVKNEKKNIYSAFFEKCWSLYPNKKGKGSVKESQIKRLFEEVGEEQFIRCIQRYSDEVKGWEPKYIKHGSTFFNSGYVDYLDANLEGQNGAHSGSNKSGYDCSKLYYKPNSGDGNNTTEGV